MLGDYAVEVEVNGERHRQEFKVQDYRKPDFQVTVSTDREKYVNGDTVEVTVQAEYFFGEPVANAPISIQQYNLWEYTDYWAEDGPTTTTVWGDYYSDEAIKGVTDQDGFFTFFLTASYQADAYYYYWDSLQHDTYSVEVTVDDGSHQTSGAAVFGYTTPTALPWILVAISNRREAFTVRSVFTLLDGDPLAIARCPWSCVDGIRTPMITISSSNRPKWRPEQMGMPAFPLP
jgi:uncharacterized protein YfaS (alpha-2-macroglobulin family)